MGTTGIGSLVTSKLANNLEASEYYMNMIRDAAYKAMLSSRGENN